MREAGLCGPTRRQRGEGLAGSVAADGPRARRDGCAVEYSARAEGPARGGVHPTPAAPQGQRERGKSSGGCADSESPARGPRSLSLAPPRRRLARPPPAGGAGIDCAGRPQRRSMPPRRPAPLRNLTPLSSSLICAFSRISRSS